MTTQSITPGTYVLPTRLAGYKPGAVFSTDSLPVSAREKVVAYLKHAENAYPRNGCRVVLDERGDVVEAFGSF